MLKKTAAFLNRRELSFIIYTIHIVYENIRPFPFQ